MPDYQEGKIYKILNTCTDDVYIGSTTQMLCNRMKSHRRNHKYSGNKSHYKLYQAFSENGVENFYIEILEKCPCTCKEDLLAREGHWIRKEKPSLNTRTPGRTKIEWFQDNKDKMKEYKKEYYEKNKDKTHQLPMNGYNVNVGVQLRN